MTTPLPRVASSSQQSPSPAAKAASRYLNKASGRMETAQQIHSYRAPTPKPVPPPGHNVQNTTHTVTRTTTNTPRAPVSFINKSPAEVEDTARKLTAAEVSGIRGAYAPQNALLGQQEQGALGAHATSYGQLQGTIGGLQSQQAGTAKTFENYAADAINKASTAAPGAAQTAEHLGLKPGEALPESAQRQQEAARTLLSGIAQAGQAGTTARQEGEANFLTNMQGTAALGNAEGARNIVGRFGLEKGKLGTQEGAAIAKAQGNQAKLGQSLFGEQSKLRAAAEATLGKKLDFETKAAATSSKIQSERTKEREGQQKIGISARKNELGAEANEYKTASLEEKERLDKANVKDKEGKLKELGRKLKISEEKAGPGGTKISAAQKAKYEKEMTTALNAFERGPNIEGKNKGRDFQRIRNELTAGENVKIGGKAKLVKGQAVNPVILNAMEQVFKYHYVNPETKKALAALGVPSEGLSNLLLRR